MAKRWHMLKIAGALTLAGLATAAVVADSERCTTLEMSSGSCPKLTSTITEDGLQLDVTDDNSSSSNQNGTGVRDSKGGGPAPVAASDGRWPAEGSPGPGRVVRPGHTITSAITVSDLVHFRPEAGTSHMQPVGWTVVGLDTNFYAHADVQVQTGPLLDELATVRFIPIGYHWSYGDGDVATHSIPGASWRALGAGQFEPTATSHAYARPGTYNIDLTIEFAAEYRWAGGDWTSVIGTIQVPANRLTVIVGGAKTVLVEHDCTRNPTGPGC